MGLRLPVYLPLKNRKIILAFVVVIIIIISAALKIQNNNLATKPSPFNPKENASPLDTIFQNAYASRKNADGSHDYFIKGTIEKITDKSPNNYLITLRSISGNSMGRMITFSLPKVPPKEGSIVLGKNFQEMYNRGFHTINMRISFASNNEFTGWGLVQ